MIWPWSEIARLKSLVMAMENRALHAEKWSAVAWRTTAKHAIELRAAHKGIRRLVEKVKRLEGK